MNPVKQTQKDFLQFDIDVKIETVRMPKGTNSPLKIQLLLALFS